MEALWFLSIPFALSIGSPALSRAFHSISSGGQPTQVRIQALEPRAEQIQTVGTENVESFLIESRVCTLYVYCMSAPRL